jgi:serine/threonine-protein kinase
MDAHRTAQLAELFDRALEMPSAERMDFVQAVCSDDAELRQELTSLLEAHDSSGAFFEALAAEVVSPACTALVEGGSPVTDSALRPELEAALHGRYRLQQELGGGSMSRVFLAEEIGLGRNVVIKVLPPQLTVTMSGDRFRREIQLAAQLQHPHIVPVLTSESIGRLLYYTMPFIAGESLRARLTRDGPLPVREALSIWRDVLDALAHAHAARVVHRDIKPGNILLTGRNALVSDFGIARAIEAAAEDAALTAPGIPGTPAYMAPEQATGDPRADPRADIYAAGLVMYEMLEGRRPFAGGSSRDVMRARLDRDPLPIARPDCPPELAALVRRCLAREPIDRPANADDILAELETLSGGGRTAPRWAPRRRVLTYSLVLAGVTAAALAARSLRGRTAEPSPAAPAPASIAILPLTNLSTDANDASLAEEMTEELNATLSRGSILRVVASTSVRALKDRQLDVRQIAESLRVSHFLEGAVQKVGSRLRLQVRLVDARDGSTRWSETYDRHMGDIFAVQDDIARAVAGELDARLASGAGAVPRPRHYTPSLIAYEAYLRGKNSGLRSSAGRREGIEHFKEAIAADSGFAAAHVASLRGPAKRRAVRSS